MKDGKLNFEEQIAYLAGSGTYEAKELPPHLMFRNARELFERGMRYFIGNRFQWLPGYDMIVDWMRDNECKGLTLMGNCGQGKTVFAKSLLPLIVNHYYGLFLNCYNATDMMRDPDKVLSKHLVSVDDVGVEGATMIYGQKSIAFSELCDLAEKKGKLLIVTTNLSMAEIAKRYGERTRSRLMALTRGIAFNGEDLRGLGDGSSFATLPLSEHPKQE